MADPVEWRDSAYPCATCGLPRLPVLTWAELIESDDKPFGRLAMTDSPVSATSYGLCQCDDAITDVLLARHFVGQRHVARWTAQLHSDAGPVDVGGLP